MPRPLLIVCQSVSLIQIVDRIPHTKWQRVQIQISWLLQSDCLQRQDISGFSRTRVKEALRILTKMTTSEIRNWKSGWKTVNFWKSLKQGRLLHYAYVLWLFHYTNAYLWCLLRVSRYYNVDKTTWLRNCSRSSYKYMLKLESSVTFLDESKFCYLAVNPSPAEPGYALPLQTV